MGLENGGVWKPLLRVFDFFEDSYVWTLLSYWDYRSLQRLKETHILLLLFSSVFV